MDYDQASLAAHERLKGKIGLANKMELATREDLSIAYTPGVAEPCRVIASDPTAARRLTVKGNSIAVVSDGSAVLGLGNIGGLASLPVMEGKAMLFKKFADIDAWPIVLDTQDPDEVIRTVRNIAPGFGGINLEDIAAPNCFRIEEELQDLGIPVFHDDQHGTAIVLLAALINSAKLLGKKITDLHIVINGAGAAGTAIARLIRCMGHGGSACVSVADVLVCDSKGIIHPGRDNLNPEKRGLLEYTNRKDRSGSLRDALAGADVFIGVSKGNILTGDDIKLMAKDPVILAMANPTPEIMPDVAIAAGAAIVGTGRSDFPNQVNNVLVFPGIFRGALDAGAERITSAMKLVAAETLAAATPNVARDSILPSVFEPGIADKISAAVIAAYQSEPPKS